MGSIILRAKNKDFPPVRADLSYLSNVKREKLSLMVSKIAVCFSRDQQRAILSPFVQKLYMGINKYFILVLGDCGGLKREKEAFKMDNVENFLEKIADLKTKTDEMKPEEYFRTLDSYVFTYCPKNAYYKGDYLKTMELINNNDMETIRRCLI